MIFYSLCVSFQLKAS